MPTRAASLIPNLQQANARLRLVLERIPRQVEPSSTIAPGLVLALLTELRHAGEWLRLALPPAAEREPALNAELEAYRLQIKRLRSLLPCIHRHLLEERTRLEAERSRVAAASNWAQVSRQTL